MCEDMYIYIFFFLNDFGAYTIHHVDSHCAKVFPLLI